ncbi:MAG: c-type cytochrome [Burkholderiales bacterium]
MKWILVAALTAGAMAAGNAIATDKLAQSSGCMTCHAVDKKLIGPGFKEIAAKYKNDKGAEAKLAQKIKSGGSGVWGTIPMPPNAHVKESDIKTLAQWVLSRK